MVALAAGTGFGGAAKDFFSRHRVSVLSIVLSLVGIATGTAAAAALLQFASPAGPLVVAAGALLAAACCAAQTRHLGLAAMAAAAPLPGLLWAAPLSGGENFGAVPILAYAFAFAVAALRAQAAVDRALRDGNEEYPWWAAACAVGLMAVLGVLWFWGTGRRDAAMQSVADVTLAVFSAAVLLPLAASVLHFDENFVARANRARERRQRLLERLAFVALPRWGLSFAGIALVLLALGWFGAEPAMRTGTGAAVLRVVSAGLVAVAATFFMRGWREGLATGFAVAVVGLVSLWAVAAGRYDPMAPVGVIEAAALAVFLALHSGRRALSYRARGEAPALARQRTIEETSAGQVFAAAGALAAVLPAAVLWPAIIPLAVGVVAAGFGGIVWAPAGTAALECLFPRHRSADELYATHKKSQA